MGVEEYIPDRIARLSEKRGYTKYRLSQITGMTQTALGNILSQKSIPTLERICDAFNITLAQFFSEDGSRLDLTDEQSEILEVWDGLDVKEKEILLSFIRSLKK